MKKLLCATPVAEVIMQQTTPSTVNDRGRSPTQYRARQIDANSIVTQLAAVTPPGQSLESNARTTGIAQNVQRPRPVWPVSPGCQQTPDTMVVRPAPGHTSASPSAPNNYQMPPAGFVTRSGRVNHDAWTSDQISRRANVTTETL